MTDIMDNNSSPYKYFLSLLEIGQTVLDAQEDNILKLFKHNEICLMKYHFGEIRNTVLELHFEQATLSCIINNSGLCNLSILFMDSLTDIAHYIRCCDSNYTYNYEFNIWQRDIGYIRLNHSDDTGNRIAFIQCLNKDSILKDKIC